ncbi:MAG: ABC transporter substrate-binding protein [Microbacterium sp.]
MSTSSRRALRALGIFTSASATLLLLAGCSSSDDTADGNFEATMQLGWIANVENMGPYVAERDGLYADQGVDLTIAPGGPSTTVEPLVQSDKVLVGVSSTDTIARANTEGADLVIVAATLQVNPTSIMSLADAPVNTLEDLIGKRLCIQTSGVAGMDAILAQNGIDKDDVEYVTADFDPSPLVAGDCDAFLSFLNNQPITLQQQGIDTVTFTLDKYGYNSWGDVLFVKRSSLEDEAKRDAITGIVAATQKGWETALADTDAAAEYVVEGPGKDQNLDLEQQKLAAVTYIDLVATDETKANGLLTMSEDGIAANIKTLEDQGVEGDFDTLFDTSVLDDIANEN